MEAKDEEEEVRLSIEASRVLPTPTPRPSWDQWSALAPDFISAT
jgi:hypothetical protein